MSEKERGRIVNRRNALKSVGAFSSTIVFTGAAAAKGRSGSNGPGNQTVDTAEKPFDPDDWEVDFEPKEESDDVETYVYVGSNKNAEPTTNGTPPDQDISTHASGSITSPSVTVPSEAPVIGGTEIYVKITGEIGWSGASIGASVCADGYCIELAGAGISLNDASVCLDGKGKIYGVPVSVEGCLTVDPDVWDRELTVGGSVDFCILQDDPCDDPPTWVENHYDWTTISCQPCLTGLEVSGTIP